MPRFRKPAAVACRQTIQRRGSAFVANQCSHYGGPIRPRAVLASLNPKVRPTWQELRREVDRLKAAAASHVTAAAERRGSAAAPGGDNRDAKRETAADEAANR